MRTYPRSVGVLLGLATLGLFTAPAFASPGNPGQQPSANESSGSPYANVDLSMRPSLLEHLQPKSGVDITPAEPKPTPRGQFCGPIFIEGVYAQHLQHLPKSMREGMAKPVGPTFLVVETPHIGATGAGAGLYGRF
jgi:hypothetical protein